MKHDSIVFVTHISYLDGAIEHIKLASQQYVNFNVVITLSPTQIFRNIIDLRHVDTEKYGAIADFNEICEEWKMELFAPYFEYCKSVNFLIYHESGVKNAISVTKTINKHIRNLKPRYIHFDSYINRQVFQIPFLFANRRKIILNVHDAKPHSGEEDKIRIFLQRLLYKWSHKFVTFSQFSKVQLEEQISKKKKVINSFLLPFNFYKNYSDDYSPSTQRPDKISFVGRISKYKGIDLFVAGINKVHETKPNQEFVIAGNPYGNHIPDYSVVKNSSKLEVIQKHLSNAELVQIILKSQLIVCPYLDASQSGVIMTALALNRPVLVTEAGGLMEYVTEGVNGMISKIDADDLASRMKEYASKNQFVEMNKKMKSHDYAEGINKNYLALLGEIYA